MQTEKKQLRVLLRARRKSLSPAEVTDKSRWITQRLVSFPAFYRASTIILYSANDNEVVTEALWRESLKQGKRVYYPRISEDRADLEFVRRHSEAMLISGTFGILVPPGDEVLSRLQPNDIVCTPGVGFDEKGHRLGRGKGYYDRALRGALAGALRVALAYECQLVPEIPSGPEDEQVQWIVTEERIVNCAG